MKKYIVFLLCLIMLISLVSCGETKNNTDLTSNTDNQNKDTQDSDYSNEKTPTSLEIYNPVLEVYRLAVDELKALYSFVNANPQGSASELFGLESSTKKEWFLSIIDSIFFFYGGHGEENSISPHHKLSCGYAIKDLNDDGVDELVLLTSDYMVCAIFSITNGQPILLRNYRTRHRGWIDSDGLIHENGSSGADYSTNAVYKIADGGKSLELVAEFGTNGHEWVDDVAYTIYYKLVAGEKKTITEAEYQALNEQHGKYLGSVAGAEATKKHSGLTFTSLYTEAEIAMEMYEAALKNEIRVCETDIEEWNYLKDCKTPYNRIPLCELESMRYAYMDVDGDSINELVVDCGDTLILRYYEGTVYVYPVTFRNMYQLNTDGSYSWNHTGQDFEYGEKQIYFEGAELKTKELWRIVNDGEPNAEYYIDDKQVTQEEILKYFEDNPKTKVEFSPLEVSWESNEYPNGKG